MQPGGESSYEARIVRAVMQLVDAEERRDEQEMSRHLVDAVVAARQLRHERESHPELAATRIEYDDEPSGSWVEQLARNWERRTAFLQSEPAIRYEIELCIKELRAWRGGESR